MPPNGGMTNGRMPVGLLGGVGTTEGHGEEGNGSVGRWTAVLAADPSLLASKMEPILRDASTIKKIKIIIINGLKWTLWNV